MAQLMQQLQLAERTVTPPCPKVIAGLSTLYLESAHKIGFGYLNLSQPSNRHNPYPSNRNWCRPVFVIDPLIPTALLIDCFGPIT